MTEHLFTEQPRAVQERTGFAAHIPTPPSTNNLFATVMVKGKPRRIVTREYKAWRQEAELILLAAWIDARSPKIGKPWALAIEVNIDHGGDVTNRIKAIEDLLVSTIPGIPGDQWVNECRIARNREIAAARVDVWTL